MIIPFATYHTDLASDYCCLFVHEHATAPVYRSAYEVNSPHARSDLHRPLPSRIAHQTDNCEMITPLTPNFHWEMYICFMYVNAVAPPASMHQSNQNNTKKQTGRAQLRNVGQHHRRQWHGMMMMARVLFKQTNCRTIYNTRGHTHTHTRPHVCKLARWTADTSVRDSITIRFSELPARARARSRFS